MDFEVLAQKVEEYRFLWTTANASFERRNVQYGYLDDPEYRSTVSEMNSRLGLIEKIAECVDPRLPDRLRGQGRTR